MGLAVVAVCSYRCSRRLARSAVVGDDQASVGRRNPIRSGCCGSVLRTLSNNTDEEKKNGCNDRDGGIASVVVIGEFVRGYCCCEVLHAHRDRARVTASRSSQ